MAGTKEQMQMRKKSKFSGEPTPKKIKKDPALNPDEAEDEEDNEDAENKTDTRVLSTCVNILGLTRSGKLDEDAKSWYNFFKYDAQVEVPLVQNPVTDDPWVIFKMQSLDDKRKLYPYIKKNKCNGNKIIVKTITYKEDKDVPERKPLTQDEALDILYPGRNVLYADRLKDKYAKVKTIVEENLVPIKDTEMLKEFVPMTPIDGYENKVLVHIEKSPTGEVLYGLRAVDYSTNGNAIVPLEHCMSVPRQIVPVVKGFISGLLAVGLNAYDPEENTGDLLGVVLRLTELGTFMVIIILRKPDPTGFHELSPGGIALKEGEELGIPFQQQITETFDDSKLKLTKFFESEKTTLGIQGLFMILVPDYVLISQMASRVWRNLPKPEHVMGDTELLEKVNDVELKLEWNIHPHTVTFKSVLNLLGPFNRDTTIFLISPIIHIGYYFAKKCGHVTQIGLWSSGAVTKLKDTAKEEGITNINYYNFQMHLKKTILTDNSVAIWWPFLASTSYKKNKKFDYIFQLLDLKITNMVFISYWNRARENHLPPHMKKVYSKLNINKIVPFDTEPYKEGFGLFLDFKGLRTQPSNQTSHPNQN